MDEQSGESEEEEVMGEGIGESEMVQEWGWGGVQSHISYVTKRHLNDWTFTETGFIS